jgi:hypothetical protein
MGRRAGGKASAYNSGTFGVLYAAYCVDLQLEPRRLMMSDMQKRTKARDFRQPRDNVWRENAPRRGDWAPLDMNNADFEEYYQTQKIVPEGDQAAGHAAMCMHAYIWCRAF